MFMFYQWYYNYYNYRKRFVNENYTKELEEIMDKIEKSNEDYTKALEKLFEDVIEKYYQGTPFENYIKPNKKFQIFIGL